jgi:hypothetical protein
MPNLGSFISVTKLDSSGPSPRFELLRLKEAGDEEPDEGLEGANPDGKLEGESVIICEGLVGVWEGVVDLISSCEDIVRSGPKNDFTKGRRTGKK